ncbi:MAG: hypothetical protein IPK35_23255 [Saprospiraceae bacterium]|nr:hypothetical protein [Saprospiraceae bacterium]
MPLSDHVQTILDHEKIHIRHWHTVDVLFAEIVQAFYWFNPVMIFYKRALRQAHEYLADDIICRDKSVSSYTDLLLSKSQSGMEMALANQFFSSQIKKRIHMMTKNKTDRHAAWKYALVMPLLLGLVVVFASPEIKGDIQKVIADIITDTIPATQSANLNDVQTQSIKNLPKPPAPPPPPPLSGPEKTEPDHMELLNILLTRQSTERPLVIVDGEEKETNYLSRKGYMSGDVTIILPSEAEKIYGEAAKYGCVKIANPKFDINKVVDAFYKHIKDEEYSKKLIKSFSDTENTDSLKMYKNKISQIMEKTRPTMIAALKEQESRSLDVNLTRLTKGEEVKLPATFKIKNNDSEEDVQIKKGDLFVSGNGIRLEEDIDYVVDYGKSTIKITNPFVINGKQSLNVSFKK